MSFKTEQENFWAGDFGNEYVDRNNDIKSIATRTAVFSKIFSRTKDVNSIIEFGSNVGLNLKAIRTLLPSSSISAIEINSKAIQKLNEIPDVKVFEGSILNMEAKDLGKYDLTFTAGVLIHINPEELQKVYTNLYECSNKYILVNEYYNTKPVEVNYRGNSERLFKRDFAGDLLDLYPDLELVDYGFQYHKDHNFPLDDSTWFLLKKKK
ncbi:pseudaminic acid biosynthesis-associated methylase [Salinimicrobium terrae]|uniref:pseudaminic acid biosynthesis-associated methylase n=1 Tax=Salinimicrobium terrae TaxID=470866 RepID=UPI0004158A70|nr:pseudaminic acid biosynthesis-associated methylase [Salinimicrobium terrae]